MEIVKAAISSIIALLNFGQYIRNTYHFSNNTYLQRDRKIQVGSKVWVFTIYYDDGICNSSEKRTNAIKDGILLNV